MKRNVLCLLLAVMLVVMAAFAMIPGAMATEDDEVLVPTSEPEQTTHTHCVCGGKFDGQFGHACEEIVYDKVLSDASFETYTYKNSSLADATGSVIRSGNYILDGDTTITKTIYIPYGDTVNLCLNGYKLSSKQQLFKPNGVLNICDCSAEGTGSVYSDNSAQSPIAYTYAGSEVNIYGGTYSSKAPGANRNYAGCFTVATDNGYFDYDADGDGVAATKPGSVMNVYGGKFVGSDLTASNTDASKAPTGAGRGGCVVVMHEYATMNVYGGEFIGGATVPAANGGKMGGGVIYNAGQLNILGGTFKGSEDPICAIYSYASSASVTVSGAPVFENNAGVDIYMGNNRPLNIGDAGVSTAFTYVAGSTVGGEAALAEEVPVHEDVCICGGKLSDTVKTQSGHVCAPVTEWVPLTSANLTTYFDVKSSIYKLKDGVDELHLYLIGEYNLNYPIEVMDGEALHIDLNGFWLTHTSGKNSVLRVRGNVTVCDSSEAQSGRIVGAKKGSLNSSTQVWTPSEGATVYLLNYNSSSKTYSTPVLDIYGGYWTGYSIGQDGKKEASNKGGVFHVGNNSLDNTGFQYATLNIYGGNIYGTSAYRGGVMYVQGGIVNMYDGLITGGEAVKDASGSYGTGGNIHMIAKSFFNMYGGTIAAGNAALNGGNICMSDNAAFTMNNGTIKNGTAANRGGNVYTAVQTATFTMNDGTITGGTAATRGGNVKVLMGTFTMNGGSITGGILTDTSGSVDVYGKDLALGADSKAPVVTLNGAVTIGEVGVNGQAVAYSLRLGDNFAPTGKITLTYKNLTTVAHLADSKAQFRPLVRRVSDSGKALTRAEAAEFFTLANADHTMIFMEGNYLAVVANDEAASYYCRCGGVVSTDVLADMKHTCYDIYWTPMTQADLDAYMNAEGAIITDKLVYNGEVKENNAFTLPTGNYVLTEDITSTMPIVAVDGRTVRFDLNGKTMTFDTGAMRYGLLARGILHITDSNYDATNPDAQWGKIVGTGAVGGSAIYVCGTANQAAYKATFLFGGEYCVAPEKISCSGPIAVSGTLQLTAGKIVAPAETTSVGGAVQLNDDGGFNLWDGEVIGGKAKQGGAINSNSSKQIISIIGGKVTGGSATQYGGNIYAAATMYVKGGIIENGETLSATSYNGGNITVASGSTLTISNGLITGGKSREGGNISIRGGGKCVITGGKIENGTVTNHGGNIATYDTLEIKGGEIVGGTAVYRGGNISTYANNSEVIISGGYIHHGIVTGADEDEDGQIDKHYSQYYGTNITMQSAKIGHPVTLKVTGGVIEGAGEGSLPGVTSVHVASSGDESYTIVGGTAVVDQIRLGTGRMITIDENGLQDGASIGVERFEICGVFVEETLADYAKYFHATEENSSVIATQTETGYALALESGVNYYAFGPENYALGSADTIAEIMAIEGTSFIRVVRDVDTEEIYEGDLVIDLYGHDLFGLTVNGTLYLTDYKGHEYELEALGEYYGNTENTTIVPYFTTNRDYYPATITYLVKANADGAYSAHRVSVSITNVSLKPGSDALGFKAVVEGDSVVLESITGYGFIMSLPNCYPQTYVNEGAPVNGEFTLRLKGILAAGGGEKTITGQPILFFGDEQEFQVDGTKSTANMKTTIKAVNGMTTLTAEQKAAVYAFYDQFKEVIDTWFAADEVNNIATWAPVVEEPTPEETLPEETTPEPSTDGTDTTV